MMYAVTVALEFCNEQHIINAAHAVLLSLLHPHHVNVIWDNSGSALIAFTNALASLL